MDNDTLRGILEEMRAQRRTITSTLVTAEADDFERETAWFFFKKGGKVVRQISTKGVDGVERLPE